MDGINYFQQPMFISFPNLRENIIEECRIKIALINTSHLINKRTGEVVETDKYIFQSADMLADAILNPTEFESIVGIAYRPSEKISELLNRFLDHSEFRRNENK